MTRRVGLAIAIAATVVLASGQQASAQPVVSGTLKDASGWPAAGEVELQAWPLGTKVGQTTHNPVVARGRTDGSGHFVLSTPVTRALRRMALRTDQRRIDFTVRGTARGRLAEYTVSRFLDRHGRLVARDAGSEDAAASAASSGPGVSLALTTRMSTVAQASSPSRALDQCVTSHGTVGKAVAVTVIGELNNAYRDTKAWWAYGEGGTSTFKVGVISDGDVSVGGDATVENTKAAGSSDGPRKVYSRREFSEFEYEKTRQFNSCASPAVKYEVRPTRWLGDGTAMKQRGAIRVCNRNDRVKTSGIDGGRGFRRDDENAVDWEGGAHVFGIGLTVRSGYSKQVRSKWQFGGPSSRKHYLCGNDGPPTESGRIFSGLKRG